MRDSNLTRIILFVWAAVLVVAYNNCGGFSASGSNSLFSSDPVPVFAKTIHPILVEHCAGCHTATAPTFSIDSVSDAFTQAQNSIDINSPERSRLVQRLIADGHQCWSDCEENGQEMLNAINDFVSQIETSDEDPRIGLGAISIPGEGVLPNEEATPGVFETLTWDLSAVGAPNATFTIDIQEFGLGVYRFMRPTLNNLPENFKVKSLYLKLNGSSRSKEGTFVAIDILDTELTNRQLSSAALHVTMEVDDEGIPTGADLEPAFDVLESIGGTPRTTPTFGNVQNMLNVSCTGCHAAGGGTAGRDLTTYQAVMETPLVDDDNDPDTAPVLGNPVVIPGNFIDSPLYQRITRAQGTAGFMPVNGAPVPQSDINMIRDWILGGSPQ